MSPSQRATCGAEEPSPPTRATGWPAPSPGRGVVERGEGSSIVVLGRLEADVKGFLRPPPPAPAASAGADPTRRRSRAWTQDRLDRGQRGSSQLQVERLGGRRTARPDRRSRTRRSQPLGDQAALRRGERPERTSDQRQHVDELVVVAARSPSVDQARSSSASWISSSAPSEKKPSTQAAFAAAGAPWDSARCSRSGTSVEPLGVAQDPHDPAGEQAGRSRRSASSASAGQRCRSQLARQDASASRPTAACTRRADGASRGRCRRRAR